MATSSGTYKASAVEEMLSRDTSGRLRALHDQLVELGLKTKISSNTETLLFIALTPTKEQVGVAAMRGGNSEVLSFPKTYWIRHAAELDSALARIPSRHILPTEGPVSSSQYSLRQVRVSTDTFAELQAVVGDVVRAHVEAVQRGE
jgi:hypothetical protein